VVVVVVAVAAAVAAAVVALEVQSKTIFMGHQISSCHAPVVRSFFHLLQDHSTILKLLI
jgi:hypothetical protein